MREAADRKKILEEKFYGSSRVEAGTPTDEVADDFNEDDLDKKPKKS